MFNRFAIHFDQRHLQKIVAATRLVSFMMLAPSVALSSSFYNLTEYNVDSGSRVSLPASWQPNPGTVNYTGSLDAYWLARLANDHDTVEISKGNALSLGLPADFSLETAPDNCWGMDMGFGLVTLAQASNLSITVEADHSGVVPAFALYKGWDTSKSASRHTTIYFGTNNPLGTQGLTFVDDAIGAQAGGSINQTFTNLPAGNYEIFVTVGTNRSAAGQYKVTLVTTPTGGGSQAPGSPTDVVATAGDAKAQVNWTAPISNGGSAITGYTVTSAPEGKTCASVTPGCQVAGLTNGTAYTFTVTATNAVGISVPSNPSNSVTPLAATVPDSPTLVNASAGDGQAYVNWTAPSSNGGSAITGYSAIATPGGNSCNSTSLGCSVLGLSNGTPYTFKVTATNAVGTSLPSVPSNTVTPTAAPTVPSVPTQVVATAGNQAAIVSWSPPVNMGGSAINGYRVISTPNSSGCTTATTTCTVHGLSNGTAYSFNVIATNATGDSDPSSPSNTVTPAAPVITDRLAYNLNPSGALPAQWNQVPASLNYVGNLPVYWWAHLATNHETMQLSRADAIRNGAGAGFDLWTNSPNTNGESINFGLVRLDAASDLEIAVTADGSQGSPLIPGVVLYQGWNTSSAANRYQDYTPGQNNPLGTQGLIYLDQSFAENQGETAHFIAENLQPGDYQVFVTVGKNASPGGSYQLSLSTTPPPASGRCGVAANQLSPQQPPEGDLCASGTSSQLRRLAKSRYEWLCSADVDIPTGERCYTLGKDGRLNQAPLILNPGNATVVVGESVIELAEGGSGTGKISFAKKSVSKGTRCQLKVKKNQLTIKAGGKPGQCQITATKAASKGLNKVESYPATVFVTQ